MDHTGDVLDDNGDLDLYHHPTLEGLQLSDHQYLGMTDENNNAASTPDYNEFLEKLFCCCPKSPVKHSLEYQITQEPRARQ